MRRSRDEWFENRSLLFFVSILLGPPRMVLADAFGSAAERLNAARSAEEMDAVVRDVRTEHQALMGKLAGLVARGDTDAVKGGACFLVGQLQGWYLADLLTSRIDVEAAGPGARAWGRYPCEQALIKVAPAGALVVHSLAQSEEEGKREHLVNALVAWYGVSRAAAMLREAMPTVEADKAKRLAA